MASRRHGQRRATGSDSPSRRGSYHRLSSTRKSEVAPDAVQHPREGRARSRHVEDIPVGQPQVIDKVVIRSRNYDGVEDIPVNYSARFSDLVSRENAFAYGFSESVKATFTFQEGGEAASFKATQQIEIGFEAHQETSEKTGEQSEQERGAGLHPICPAGYDIDFYMEREIQKIKTRLTGIGDIDHGIMVGKHWDGHWNGHRGEGGKRWPRWGKWDSFGEFMSVIKGEGRRDLCFAEWFWDNPAPKWLVGELEKPLNMPFDHTGRPFDNATQLTIGQTVIRGPKEETQRVVMSDKIVASLLSASTPV